MAGVTDALRVASEISKNEASAKQSNSQASVNDVLAGLKTKETAKVEQETNRVREEIKKVRYEIGKVKADMQNVKMDSRIKQLQSAMHEVDSLLYSGDYGAALRVLEKPGVAGTAGMIGYSVTGYIKAIKSLKQQANIAKQKYDDKAAERSLKINKGHRYGRSQVTRSKR